MQMNITDLEMTQATIEIYGGFICLMLAVIIKINGYERKSWNLLKWMLISVAVNFNSEACAYIFRGNTDRVSIVLTRLSNFLVFFMNIVLLFLFMRYMYTLLQEKGVTAQGIFQNMVNICVVLETMVLVSNLFTGWMYYFDASNYYHRNTGWYVYTALDLVCILTAGAMGICYRKYIRKPMFAALLFYSYMPLIAIVIQTFIYGISITNIGIFLALVLMLIAYLREWSTAGKIKEKERIAVEMLVLFVIMTISMSASMISCIFSIDRISSKNSESNSMLIAHMVSERIEGTFIKPIIVAETMANDYSLKGYMKRGGEESAESVEEEMTTYLESIRDGFGYQMVFAVSDLSKAYYTYNGISKYVDPENDEHDIWYRLFWEEGRHYDLDVDTDEASHWNLSVFINTEILDEEGKALGVCGVGVEMTALQEIIRQYEQEYDIKINLIDNTGMIQVASDSERIERDYLELDLDKIGSDEFCYEDDETGIRMTRYLENLGWYLVIEAQNRNRISVVEIVTPSVFIFLIGLMMMGIVFFVISIRERKTALELKLRHEKSVTDDMTGLLNRRAYEEDCAKILETGSVSKMTVVMMDLNGLKSVNDTYGHTAGDELIIVAAKCIQTALGQYGKVYRIGGDEFVALLECDRDHLDDAIGTLNHMEKNWKGTFEGELFIAKGIVAAKDHEDMTFDEIKELSDKRMYEDKEEYYIRTGRKR